MQRTVLVLLVLLCATFFEARNSATAEIVERKRYELWTYRYIRTASYPACEIYSDPRGSWRFVLRLRKTKIDWYFQDPRLALKANKQLGNAVFDVTGRRFKAKSWTKTTWGVVFGDVPANSNDFLKALQNSVWMRIFLPVRKSYHFKLYGARAALRDAIRCWKLKLHG